MAFKTKWFSNKIVSSEGYSVRTVGRGAILYEKGDERVYVSGERLVANAGWALYPSDMRLGSEYGPELDDANLRALIVERITAVFSFMGWRLDMA